MGFSKWLQKGYERGPYKTQAALVKAVDSNPATVSRHLKAASQTLTNNPSQPSRELVIKYAKVLDLDVNTGLELAGHAPISSGKPKDLPDLLTRLEALGITNLHFVDMDKLRKSTPDELEEVLNAVRLAVEITLNRNFPNALPTNPELGNSAGRR